MSALIRLLIVGAAVAFVLAVAAKLTGSIAGLSGVGFSRACTNLTLLAIALHLTTSEKRLAK